MTEEQHLAFMQQSLYQVFALQRQSEVDLAELEATYKELCKQHHPDKNLQGTEAATERFKLIQRAYDVLRDVDKRRAYDEELGEESDYAEDDPYKEVPIPEDETRRTTFKCKVVKGGWIKDLDNPPDGRLSFKEYIKNANLMLNVNSEKDAKRQLVELVKCRVVFTNNIGEESGSRWFVRKDVVWLEQPNEKELIDWLTYVVENVNLLQNGKELATAWSAPQTVARALVPLLKQEVKKEDWLSDQQKTTRRMLFWQNGLFDFDRFEPPAPDADCATRIAALLKAFTPHRRSTFLRFNAINYMNAEFPLTQDCIDCAAFEVAVCDVYTQLFYNTFIPPNAEPDMIDEGEVLIGNLLQWLSRSLAGDNSGKTVTGLFGSTDCGKTNIQNGLKKAFGRYIATVSGNTLVKTSKPSSDPSEFKWLYTCFANDSRILIFNEVGDLSVYDGERIKLLSSGGGEGGDSIQIRKLYSMPVDYTPDFGMLLLGNAIPRIEPDDAYKRISAFQMQSQFLDPDKVAECAFGRPKDPKLKSKIASEDWIAAFTFLVLVHYSQDEPPIHPACVIEKPVAASSDSHISAEELL